MDKVEFRPLEASKNTSGKKQKIELCKASKLLSINDVQALVK
jgi:hypothetical protein